MQQYEEAFNDFSQAIQLQPARPLAYAERGNIYSLKKASSQALSDYDQALKFNDRFEGVYLNRGIEKLKIGEYRSALDDFNHAIQWASPSSITYAEAHFQRALTKEQLKDFEGSLTDYQVLLEISDQKALISEYLLKGYLHLKRWDEGIKTLG
jgi:tetratricopeptide (TPR) repeat protein